MGRGFKPGFLKIGKRRLNEIAEVLKLFFRPSDPMPVVLNGWNVETSRFWRSFHEVKLDPREDDIMVGVGSSVILFTADDIKELFRYWR